MSEVKHNSIEEINQTKTLKIHWPDSTYVFEKVDYTGDVLAVHHSFKDDKPGDQPYSNTYELNSFPIKIGQVKKVKFVPVTNGNLGHVNNNVNS